MRAEESRVEPAEAQIADAMAELRQQDHGRLSYAYMYGRVSQAYEMLAADHVASCTQDGCSTCAGVQRTRAVIAAQERREGELIGGEGS